jgi:hypothetical protein
MLRSSYVLLHNFQINTCSPFEFSLQKIVVLTSPGSRLMNFWSPSSGPNRKQGYDLLTLLVRTTCGPNSRTRYVGRFFQFFCLSYSGPYVAICCRATYRGTRCQGRTIAAAVPGHGQEAPEWDQALGTARGLYCLRSCAPCFVHQSHLVMAWPRRRHRAGLACGAMAAAY